VCCNVLWRGAMWSSVKGGLERGVQGSFLCCSVVWCVVVRCSGVQYSVVRCSVLQRVAVCCSVLQSVGS